MPERDLVTPLPATGPAPVVAPATDDSARNRLVISLLLVSAFVVILNETIMGVALPRLMSDLDITASVGQWLTTAFMLTVAVVIPITGFLLQRYSTRAIFFAAMGLFSAGTLICAVAPGFGLLLVGRIIQASGTAIMMPLLMTTIMTLVPPARRGRTMGNISIVMSVAPAVGPTISGLILTFFDWRWMFIFVLPIAVAALLLGAARIVDVTDPKKSRIDALSVVLSAFAFAGLIYGLSSIAEAARGHELIPFWLPLGVGVLALTAFVLRQIELQRHDRALLDLRASSARAASRLRSS
ncbi:MFS transporter [Microbacterium sp.]|uniref:MFS transporter n=1 Tax=Microbacterium sp. TaxID=51671 RepID=UPI002812147E|nr:MFS transporter [Microbacterium sp.]